MRFRISRRTHGPVLAALALLVFLLLTPTGYEGALTYQGADRVRAEVLSCDESDLVDTGLIRTGEQRCSVRLLAGHFAGRTVTAVNRLNGSLAQDKLFSPGDIAFVVVSYSGGDIITVSMTDHYRLDKEALLAGLFLLLLVAFGRGHRRSGHPILCGHDFADVEGAGAVPAAGVEPGVGRSWAGAGADGIDSQPDLRLRPPVPGGHRRRGAGHRRDGRCWAWHSPICSGFTGLLWNPVRAFCMRAIKT